MKIFKKSIAIILLFSCIMNISYAQKPMENEFAILEEFHILTLDNMDTQMTRKDGLISVLRVAGAFDGMEITSMDYDSPLPECIRYLEVPFKEEPLPGNEKGYLYAARVSGIAYGNSKESPRYFYPERGLTTSDLMAFVIRCVDRESIDEFDTAVTYDRALTLGLLKTTDSFKDPNTMLTKKELCTVLLRMLECKRVIYYAYSSYTYLDIENNMTYREYLEKLYSEVLEEYYSQGCTF